MSNEKLLIRKKRLSYEDKKRKQSQSILKRIMSYIVVLIVAIVGGNLLFDKNQASAGNNDSEIVINKDKVVKEPKPDDLMPGRNVTNEGFQYGVDAKVVSEMEKGTYTGDEKYVFLTFDDGPSHLTEEILDILDSKGVKATFFVLGKSLEASEQAKLTLKRTLKEGHAIANHSYSHSLKKLYPNNKVDVNYFMEEFKKTNDIMKEILGQDFNSKVLRMPGGHNSREYYNDPQLENLDNTLNENGIVSVDWNSLNGDAEGIDYSVDEMIEYVKSSSEGVKQPVILMHDAYGKEKTVQALPEIIDYFLNQGYEFKTIM